MPIRENPWPPAPTANKKLDLPMVEADAQYDVVSDTILVRVRRLYRNKDGQLVRRGLVFRLTDEMLVATPEGCEYPQKSMNRFESITDELND